MADELTKELQALVEAGRRVVGEHLAPDHCYATGPLTGDPIEDFVVCPSCRFLEMYERYAARKAAA